MTYRIDEPYDPDHEEAPDRVPCDHCDTWFEDGTGFRLGTAYLCRSCYYRHPVIVQELAAQLRADEQRDDS